MPVRSPSGGVRSSHAIASPIDGDEDDRDRDPSRSIGSVAAEPGTPPPGRGLATAGALAPPGTTGAPTQSAGRGPAGAGCGPCLTGTTASRSLSQAVPNAATSLPSAAWNASSSVRPSTYEPMRSTMRVLAVGPDQVVDRRDALGVGEEEPLGAGRELAAETVERDERTVGGRGLDHAPVLGGVALAEVHRQTLVEPARREVVRVLDRGVEDEVGQLVGHHDLDPRIVDRVR